MASVVYFSWLFASVGLSLADKALDILPEIDAMDKHIVFLVDTILSRQLLVYEKRLTALEEKVQSQNRIIKTLESTVEKHENTINHLTKKFNDFENHLSASFKGHQYNTTDISEDNDNENDEITTGSSQKVRQQRSPSKRLMHVSRKPNPRTFADPENVAAFTAYLDHSIDYMAVGHTVKFNRVHLNDGNGFNTFSGVFTVPISGVYLFSYHWNSHYRYTVGEPMELVHYIFRLTILQLLIDNVQHAAGIASPLSNHEATGGQTIVVRVSAGQVVWLEEKYVGDGDMFIIDPQYVGQVEKAQYATFSGVLLY